MFLLSYQQVRDTGGFWLSLNNLNIIPFLCHSPPPPHPFQKLVSYKFASIIFKCCIFIVTFLLRLEEKLYAQVCTYT